jgi:hypothetical protein
MRKKRKTLAGDLSVGGQLQVSGKGFDLAFLCVSVANPF